MNIESQLIKGIQQAFQHHFQHSLSEEEVSLQPTRKDFAGSHTFVTFPYARITKQSPQQTAELIGSYLKEHTEVVKDFNVVKGFLNLELTDTIWVTALQTMVQAYQSDERPYGFQPANGQKVMIEFSSPNTNKPLHLGHLRNNFLGYAMSQILQANGYEVRKVNIVNDRGIHICKSMLAYQKFGEGETPESAGLKGDHLVGKYYVEFDKHYKVQVQELMAQGHEEEKAKKEASLMKEAQKMLKQWEQGDEEVVALWNQMNAWVYEGFNATYEKIGVSFDQIYYESKTYLLGKDIVEEGLAQGVFYRKEDGSVWIDLSEEGLDEKLVLRSDGTSVYMTQDLGTAELRHQDWPFNKLVYVVGNEQNYHFKVLFSILKRLGRTYADGLYHLSYGMVDLPSGKMKSREGTVVDADDLINEVIHEARKKTEALGKIEGLTPTQAEDLYQMLGLGAIKYFLLKVDPKKRMLFNPEESVQLQGDTAPFIQYTHARIAAILQKARAENIDFSNTNAFGDLESIQAAEQEAIELLTAFPQKIQSAGADYAPSIIAQYVFDLAKAYNRFYTEVPIFSEENTPVLTFRVALSFAVAQTIQHGLALLGIQAPEQM
uniref:Arginine--tRNA ligase n=1 Tax=Roseihalotalea indica TaxID=2867963 RepID=A0AA49GRV9_9BACT|nr:arginine--tRNA ligase [Tunicatimonas sp. TK19036]